MRLTRRPRRHKQPIGREMRNHLSHFLCWWKLTTNLFMLLLLCSEETGCRSASQAFILWTIQGRRQERSFVRKEAGFSRRPPAGLENCRAENISPVLRNIFGRQARSYVYKLVLIIYIFTYQRQLLFRYDASPVPCPAKNCPRVPLLCV